MDVVVAIVSSENIDVEHLLFSTFKLPAVSRAFDASFGKFVKTTEAAIVRGASDVSSSSGIRSLGESDMMWEE